MLKNKKEILLYKNYSPLSSLLNKYIIMKISEIKPLQFLTKAHYLKIYKLINLFVYLFIKE